MTDSAKQVEGTIQKVIGDAVTLADGTELVIPPDPNGHRDDLRPGTSVKASYVEKAGQKVVAFLQVESMKTFGAPPEGCC